MGLSSGGWEGSLKLRGSQGRLNRLIGLGGLVRSCCLVMPWERRPKEDRPLDAQVADSQADALDLLAAS